MEIIESQYHINLQEELEELRLVIAKNPTNALALVNQLIDKAENIRDLKLKAEVYHVKGLILHQQNKYSQALEAYSKSLHLRQQANDKKGEGISLNNIGLVLLDTEQYQNAINYFEQSLEVKKKHADYKSITATYENLGVAFQKIADYKKAIKIFYQSLKISELHDDTQRMATTYQNIGVTHFMQEDTKYALEMFNKALQLLQQIGDPIQLIQLKNNIGAMHKQLKKYKNAVVYFKDCLRMSLLENYEVGILASYNNLGEIYRENLEYTEAISAYSSCYKMSKNTRSKSMQTTAAMNLAEIYTAQKKISPAKKYLTEALGLSTITKDIQNQKRIFLLFSQLYEQQGKMREALENFKKHDTLKSQLLNIENSRVINELKTKHDVDKTERENEIHRLKNIELKGALDNLTTEKQKSESLLLNILPAEIADELKETGKVKAKYFDSVSVLFCDIKDFTKHSEKLSPEELVQLLDLYFQIFDDIIRKHGIEKIKTIGDAYLCVCGLPNVTNTHAIKITKAALEMLRVVEKENAKRKKSNQPFFEFRIGINSGPVVAGIVGKTKFEYDIWGDTVNTAARMEQSGEAGKINISAASYNLIKSKYKCIYRGKIQAKNKGSIDMYFVETSSAAKTSARK